MYSWIDNYIEFQNLSNNADYYDIQFDWMSGGVSAIHKDHCFDKSIGPFGIKRGDYEIRVTDFLRIRGHRIILLPESNVDNIGEKHFDCNIDGRAGKIKTIEGVGRWNVRTKIYDAAKQKAEVLILYFPPKTLYRYERKVEGWIMTEQFAILNNIQLSVSKIIPVIDTAVFEKLKPPG